MSADTWYLIFGAFSAIGSAWMANKETPNGNEIEGSLIIFAGFIVQTIYYIVIHQWECTTTLLLVLFVALWVVIYWGIRKLRNTW